MKVVPVKLDPQAWEGVDPGTEALLENWSVAPGDTVAAGQAVGSAVLVKTTLELSAPQAGRVARLEVERGATFGPGAVLAWIEAAG
ncbi:MAG: lipoyl domain-containing protein [Betaproteobacteria bacterium]|nr:lipoyl domain-containing protein [Betaproteobacteria bacterium]